jgi:hypothetical protein
MHFALRNCLCKLVLRVYCVTLWVFLNYKQNSFIALYLPVCRFWRVNSIILKTVIFVFRPPVGPLLVVSTGLAVVSFGCFKQLNESCGRWPQTDSCVYRKLQYVFTVTEHGCENRLWLSDEFGVNCTFVTDFSNYKQNSYLTSWEMYT